MSKNDELQKAIGRLEKGQEIVEKGLDRVERNSQDFNEKVLLELQSMRRDFTNDMKEMHIKFENAVQGQHNIKLTVQKLATTVSLVVAVAAFIAKDIFDVAKNALAASFHP